MNCKRCHGLLVPPSDPSVRKSVYLQFHRNGGICDECRRDSSLGFDGGVMFWGAGAVLIAVGYMMESIGVVSSGVLSFGVGFWRQKRA